MEESKAKHDHVHVIKSDPPENMQRVKSRIFGHSVITEYRIGGGLNG